MVGGLLQDRIEEFVRRVGEGVDQRYVIVEGVTTRQLGRIRDAHYIHTIIEHEDSTEADILAVLEESWEARIRRGEVHGKAREWGRAASGLAHYLLKPTEIEEVDGSVAADLVVRISRWDHSSEACNIWKRFRPFAHRVVELAWGSIEALYAP